MGSVSDESAIQQVDPERPDPDVLATAARLLHEGHLVVFPTETVYGLGADARNPAAVRAIFEGKGRPATDPVIVHVDSVVAARAAVSEWPATAQALAERFWPGPLTMVLPRSAELPASLAAGRSTVAVRIPAHPVALGLLREAGIPVAAPSANRFGRISPTTAAHVVDELDGVFALLIDGGPTPLGVESTVVDLTGARPELLRPGGVTLEDLRDTLGEVDHLDRHVTAEDQAAAGPGTLLRHYAPSTPTALVEGGVELVAHLCSSLERRGIRAAEVELPEDPSEAARVLYASLRSADTSGADVLLVRTVDPSGVGRAVNDRLFRAAHGRVLVDAGPDTLERLVAIVERPAPD